MVRQNNQLPNNLPQLQNLIKRDPESYKDEFLQQYKHFMSLIDIFRLSPTENDTNLDELVMFLAQVSLCFPKELQDFPQILIDLLKSHGPILDATTRMSFCKALILLRNKKLLPALVLLELFFTLLRCSDKELRIFLQTHIVTDIKNMNAKHKDAKVNSSLQGFMYSMLKDTNAKAAKMSIDIMIDLYKKNIWNNAKTVNVIATSGCFSKLIKVRVAALKFFLGTDPNEKNSDDSDSEDEPSAKEAMMANKVNKKSRKREKQLSKVKKQVVKSRKKKGSAPIFNYSALQLVHNPQGLAEGLYKQLEVANERFEVKLMTLDVISRLIGLHELFLFNIYPYMQRYLQPHQREVTRILQFTAQASHELLPPETLHSVLRAIVNNFVTERNSSDVIAIGLNAIREICSRCPLAMEEDLLRDLAQFKTYRDRAVMMASKSLIHLYRETHPDLLHRKDRGRPTEHQASIKPLKYGEIKAPDYVPGAEALINSFNAEKDNEDIENANSDDSDWVDIEDDSEGELHISESDAEVEENDITKGEDDVSKTGEDLLDIEEPKKDTVTVAQMLSVERIFTDADYRKMEIAQAKSKVLPSRKRPADELVSLADIENIHKKRKHDKASRLEAVKEGQKDRERFGYKDGRLNIHCSKTNREKRKKKNFQMIKHKIRGKIKRSFQDKQRAFRNHLIQQKKMK